MAEKKKGSRTRTTYSMFRLDTATKSQDPASPECPWSPVAEFDTNADALTAARILRAHDGYDGEHFSIEKVIRSIESAPKSTRNVI